LLVSFWYILDILKHLNVHPHILWSFRNKINILILLLICFESFLITWIHKCLRYEVENFFILFNSYLHYSMKLVFKAYLFNIRILIDDSPLFIDSIQNVLIFDTMPKIHKVTAVWVLGKFPIRLLIMHKVFQYCILTLIWRTVKPNYFLHFMLYV